VPYRVSTDHGRDPHWWGDPRNVAAAATTTANAIARAAPALRRGVEARARRYRAALHRLDATLARCFASVPGARRRLVTAHDAFATFARRYGIHVVGAVIPSATTRGQPSAGEIAALSGLIRREGVRVIYPENSVNPKLAAALAAQTGARVGPALYADTLGTPGSDGATYIAAMRHNATALLRGFGAARRGCDLRGSS
jgi:ABC-type Zn uptake system ZnuABC Zn-binding protein ZnuA